MNASPRWLCRLLPVVCLLMLSLLPAWSDTTADLQRDLNSSSATRLKALRRMVEEKIVDPALIEPLTKLAEDTDPRIREQVILLLGQQYSSYNGVSFVLTKALDDPEIAVVKAAIAGVENAFTAFESIEPLIKYATTPGSPVRAQAMGALANQWCFGLIAINTEEYRRMPGLIAAALKDPDAAMRRAVSRAIADHAESNNNTPRVLELLGPCATDADAEVRLAVMEALQYADQPQAAAVLVLGVHDKDRRVAEQAWKSLGMRSFIRERNHTFSPEFLQAVGSLLKDPDSETRFNAAALIGDKPDPAAAELLLPLLADRDGTVRACAAEGLGKAGTPAAVEPLITALKDKDPSVRMAAAGSLGSLGDKRAVEPLIAVLKDPQQDVRHNAMLSLGELGDPRAIDALLTMQKSPAALTALGKFLDDVRAVDALVAGLRAQQDDLRFAASEALLGATAPRAVDALLLAAKDKHPQVRSSAVQALYKVQGDPRVGDLMLMLLQGDEDREVIDSAAIVLGLHPDPRAARLIMWHFGRGMLRVDENGLPGGSFALQFAMGRYGEVMRQTMLKGLTDADVSVRDAALVSLVAFPDARALPGILPLLKDKREATRLQAMAVLGRLADTRGVDPLIAMLKDNSPKVKEAALYGLQQIGDARAMEAFLANRGENQSLGLEFSQNLYYLDDASKLGVLKRMLEGEDWNLRSTAVSFLAMNSDPKAADVLVDYLRAKAADGDDTPVLIKDGASPNVLKRMLALLRDQVPAVRRAAVYALSALPGEPRVREAMAAAAKDEDKEVRERAAAILRDEAKQPDQLQALLDRLNEPERREDALYRLMMHRMPRGTEVPSQRYPFFSTIHFSEYLQSFAALNAPAPAPVQDAETARVRQAVLPLLNDRDDRVRALAVDLIGDVGDPQDTDRLFTLLDDNACASAARLALARRKDPRLLDRLLPLPADDDYGKNPAIIPLGILGDPRAVEPLLEYLKRNPQSMDAILALGWLGDLRAIEPLLALLETPGPAVEEVEAPIVLAFGMLRDPRTVDPLLRLLDRLAVGGNGSSSSGDMLPKVDSYRASVIWALGQLKDPRAMEPLLLELQRGDVTDRAAAAEVLGTLGDKRAIAPLITTLPNLTGMARASAVRSLQTLTGQKLGNDTAAWQAWWEQEQKR